MKQLFTLLIAVFVLMCAPLNGNAQPDRHKEYTELQLAIRNNDMSKVKRLITNGADINGENKWGESAVETAIKSNRLEMVKLLLDKGASSRWGMQYAVENNNAHMVRLLLNNDFDFGYSLVYAAENNNLSMVQMLVKNGAKVRISQKRKRGLFRKYYVSPIEMAIKHGNKAMTLFLIDNGALMSEAIDESFAYDKIAILKVLIDRSEDKNQFLEPAFMHENTLIVDYAVSKGADMHTKGADGNSMLHLSAVNGSLPMVQSCVEKHGINVGIKNNRNETPLMLAVQKNKQTIVSYLLNNGADIAAQNDNGETALFYTTSDDPSMFNLLVKHGADVSHRTNNNTTLLINSAKNKNYSAVKLLLENGASIEDKNDDGYTAFHYLIQPHGRNSEIIDEFLSRGADINTKNVGSGKSLMYYAIESERIEKVKALVEKGADINTLDSKGNRPRIDDVELIKYLVENGAEINAVDSRHDSFICVAVDDNNLELAHYLISKGIDVNQNCYFEEPPLIKAIEDENLVLVQFLADNGADINAVGYFERNVMEYAERKGNQEIIDFLKSRGAMTKNDRNELYRKSMEMESDLRSAMYSEDEERLAGLLKQTEGLIIQDKIINNVAVFAAEKGNPVLVELLIAKRKLDIDTELNAKNQTMLIVATIHDETSLVSYLINKGSNMDIRDTEGKIAKDYARTKAMRKIYKQFK